MVGGFGPISFGSAWVMNIYMLSAIYMPYYLAKLSFKPLLMDVQPAGMALTGKIPAAAAVTALA